MEEMRRRARVERVFKRCNRQSSIGSVHQRPVPTGVLQQLNKHNYMDDPSSSSFSATSQISSSTTSNSDFASRLSSESAAPSTSTPSPRRSSQNQTGSASLTSSAVTTVIPSHPGHTPSAQVEQNHRLSTSTTTPNTSIRIRSNSRQESDSAGTVRSALTSHRSSVNGQNTPWTPNGTPLYNSYNNHHHSYPVGPHSPSPYDTTSLIGPTAQSTEESPRIWQSANHTTNMLINDSAQACTSTIPHHQFDKISSTSNGYRKSLVLNGTPNHYPTNNNNGSISERTVAPQKNGYYNGHSMTNGSANPTTEFPPTPNGMHGTISRRSLVNGMTQSAREPVYKASPRIVQPMANGKLNGTQAQNGSPRNSIASYTSYTSTNGSSNNPINGDYSNGSPKRKSPTRQQSASPTSIAGEDSIVQVRMSPDSQGRYGFNVSGGYDRGHPVIVSRVIAGSPADRCHPRLNEGDQVLKINGQDISQWDYDRVVAYIRHVRTNSILGEITLLIKPNVYRCGEFDESESLQNSIPETPHVAETVPRSDKLAQSLLLQKEAIESGKILRQFEQLYRKKPGLTMNDSRTPNNLNKNRYRDVCPYDSTRVHLEKAPTGDYINASHVNMEIPSSGIVNRYVATQGPLANTTGDFWYMVWEQSCTTIVMLTTLVEKGRVKCHQYWPNRKECQEFGQLQITMVNERSEPHCQYREFALKNKLTREERRVTQMQYTAWPDHGVPENPKHFIDFVGEVRRARNGSLDPLIVHCSAGIGRTGVLILMETAACLIEANEPVYPLDIVRTMRDQRAMLIQTPDQYVFVCESILRAYNEGSIRPLAEYQKCR